MEWNRVVDARSDACGGQAHLELFPIRDPHHIEVVDRSRPDRDVWEDDRPLGIGEELVVVTCSLSPLLVPLRQMTKLHPQETRLDGVEPAVVALEVVEVFSRLAVVAQHLAAPRELLVVGRDGARLAARAQILPRIEAECRGMTHRPGLAPAVPSLREVLRAVRLAGIFDNDEVVLGREIEDRIHVSHLPVQVHGNDCRHRAASALAHRLVGYLFPYAPDLESRNILTRTL